jgi:branched-subunit amino acid transport protein
LTAWIVVLVVGAITVAFKATGPVLLGDRGLPPRLVGLVELLAPVMLSALVVTQAFGGDRSLEVDARVAGLAAAGVALWRGAGLLPTMVTAAAAAALVRLFV